MTIFHTLKEGQKYADTWVLKPKLGSIFPENRIIKSTKFAQILMPFVAVFAVVWQQFSSKGNEIAFAAAVLTAIFALTIPLQGLYWLGKRSSQRLPPQSAVKFQQIFEQLQQKNVVMQKVEHPTYFDLALLLKKAELHLSEDFWEEL